MLTRVSAQAPQPFLNSLVAPYFENLRREVLKQSGVDFLRKVGDMFRDSSFRTKKVGVALQSNHKAGRAFDYNQESNEYLAVKEPINGRMYFRTYIKCVKQDGSMGVKKTLRERRGFTYTGYVIDFTALAEKFGFTRVPAWRGWESSYNKQEFWHYQKMDGLEWEEAMRQIRGSTKPSTVGTTGSVKTPSVYLYKEGNRGEEVRKIQLRLIHYKYLASDGADGIFGKNTKAAVVAFQRNNGLDPDGIVGANTRAKLFA